MTNLATLIGDDAIAAERAALELLNELALINTALSPLEKRKREVTDALKQYMGLAGLDLLQDGETGVTARFQDRSGTPQYDLITAAARHAEALVAAGNAGLLRLDHAMLKRLRGQGGASWADELAALEMPGQGTTALVVEQGARR